MEMLLQEKNVLYNLSDSCIQNYVDDKIKDTDGKISLNLLKKQKESFEHEIDSLKELRNNKGNSASERECSWSTIFKAGSNIHHFPQNQH